MKTNRNNQEPMPEKKFRYSFVVTTIKDGEVRKGESPVIFVGTELGAKEKADSLADIIRGLNPGLSVTVEFFEHERVAQRTIDELNAANDKGNFYQRACQLMAEDFALGKQPPSLKVPELVDSYFEKAVKELYPDAAPEKSLIVTPDQAQRESLIATA